MHCQLTVLMAFLKYTVTIPQYSFVQRLLSMVFHEAWPHSFSLARATCSGLFFLVLFMLYLIDIWAGGRKGCLGNCSGLGWITSCCWKTTVLERFSLSRPRAPCICDLAHIVGTALHTSSLNISLHVEKQTDGNGVRARRLKTHTNTQIHTTTHTVLTQGWLDCGAACEMWVPAMLLRVWLGFCVQYMWMYIHIWYVFFL